MSIKPSQFDLLQKTLDAAALRHRTISRNLANVNTPEFHASHVTFEDQLADAVGGKQSLDEVTPQVELTTGLVERTDGNNVDIDQEVTNLGKNALLYETYTQLLSTKISMMRSAITGR